jgi:hypothetical protein
VKFLLTVAGWLLDASGVGMPWRLALAAAMAGLDLLLRRSKPRVVERCRCGRHVSLGRFCVLCAAASPEPLWGDGS